MKIKLNKDKFIREIPVSFIIFMFRLPKIGEDSSPLMNEYKGVVLSKVNLQKSQLKQKSSKYDWIACQLNIAESISNEAIVKKLINLQIACKSKNVSPFYSYFFVKSLLLNKDLNHLSGSRLRPVHNEELSPLRSSQVLSGQLEGFVLQTIESETKNIEAEFSKFHKIQNCIFLRQQQLRQILQNSKGQSQNFIHEIANNIRLLNIEIFELVKAWKQQLTQIQNKTFINGNIPISQFQSREPIFIYDDHNYLCKMIYDNANVINSINLKKNTKFISPPNPFFLSKDGNKQSMSQKQRENIEQAMEFFAKQKAHQLKLLLDKPEFMVKGEGIKNRAKSQIKIGLSNQNNKKQDSLKKLFGSLTKLQAPEKNYSTSKPLLSDQISDDLKNKFVSYNQRIKVEQAEKILAAYQSKSSKSLKLKEPTKNLQTRKKLNILIKKQPELQMIKWIKQKTNSPNKTEHKLLQLKNLPQKFTESPYNQRISTVRREVEKNIQTIKTTTLNQAPFKIQTLEQSPFLLTKTQKSFRSPLMNVKAPKPKIKMVTEREVDFGKATNPAMEYLSKKAEIQEQSEINLSRSKEKKQARKSYSTFFKTPEEELMQKQMLRQSRATGNRVSPGKQAMDRIKNLKRHSAQSKFFATTSDFQFKQKRQSNEIDVFQSKKRQRTIQNANRGNEVEEINSENVRDIDTELRNLKQRLRKMEIMKAYSKNVSNQNRNRMSKISQYSVKQDKNPPKKNPNSPERKEKEDKNDRSRMLRKQTQMLEQRVGKMLNKKFSKVMSKHDSIQIREEDQSNFYGNKESKEPAQNYMQASQTKSESLSMLGDENLQNLRRKKELISQGNEIKEKEIQKTQKNKEKIHNQIQQRKNRLEELESRINELKNKRRDNISKSEEKLKQSILSTEKLSLIAGQQAQKIRKLKINQSEVKRQNERLHQQMLKEQQRFIKLKEEEFNMRQELNKKKYLDQIQQIRSKYVQKQKQFERKILDEEKRRKEHEIRLMKEKRQAQQLTMKLQQQQMKELMLIEILNKEQQKWSKYEKHSDQYQEEVKRMISNELREKQQQQTKMHHIYLQDNHKLTQIMNEIKEKNRKLQQANQQKMEEVLKTIKKKQEQIKKLEELQKQVDQIEKSRHEIFQSQHRQQFIENSSLSLQKIPENDLIQTPLEQNELQELKLRLKEQILKEMIERRKREEVEEQKFEEQRKKRLKLLENQIKEFIKKQGDVGRVLEYAIPEETYKISTEVVLNQQIHQSSQKTPQRDFQEDEKVKREKLQKFEAEVNELTKDLPKLTIESSILTIQKDELQQKIEISKQKLYQQTQRSLKKDKAVNVQKEEGIQQASKININYEQSKQLKEQLAHNQAKYQENKLDSNIYSFIKPLEYSPRLSSSKKMNENEENINKSRSQLNSRQSRSKVSSAFSKGQDQQAKRYRKVKTIRLVSNIFSVVNLQRKSIQIKEITVQSPTKSRRQSKSRQGKSSQSLRPKTKNFKSIDQAPSQIQKNQKATIENKNLSPIEQDEFLPNKNIPFKKSSAEQSQKKISQNSQKQQKKDRLQDVTYSSKVEPIQEEKSEGFGDKKGEQERNDKNLAKSQKVEPVESIEQVDKSKVVIQKEMQIALNQVEKKENKKQKEKKQLNHTQEKHEQVEATGKEEKVEQKPSLIQKKNEQNKKEKDEQQTQQKKEQQPQQKSNLALNKKQVQGKPKQPHSQNRTLNQSFDVRKKDIKNPKLKTQAQGGNAQNSYGQLQKSRDSDSESKATRRAVFKTDEQMLEKFQALKEYLNLKVKFVTIEQSEIESFVKKISEAYPQQVLSMFPYKIEEIEEIMKSHKPNNKKIDLFDCNSIGWFDQNSKKYTLIGSLQCVHLVAQKYGQIQIEMAYYFDRSNLYQKKFLMKQIKMFQKVGTLFQKKLDEQNHYSLKLIIKITKDMIPNDFKTPDELFEINSTIFLRTPVFTETDKNFNKEISLFKRHKNVFWHLLADCMSTNMSKQEIEEYRKSCGKKSIDVSLFSKTLKSFNESQSSNLANCISHEQKMKSELSLLFKLPYAQLGQKIHYSFQSKQVKLSNGQKIYLSSNFTQLDHETSQWKFLVFEAEKNQLENNYLETILRPRIKEVNKIQVSKEVNLLIPAFRMNFSLNFKENDEFKKSFTHKLKASGRLIQSSISCSDSLGEQERKIIKISKKNPDQGFIFCTCYCPNNKIQKVVAGSWIGHQDLLK